MATTQAPSRGRVKVEPTGKRIRAMLGGDIVLDSTDVLLVWEVPYYPQYYIPVADVGDGVLVLNGESERSPSRGEAQLFDVKSSRSTIRSGAWHYPESPLTEIRDHVRFAWETMDSWFEEDEEVYVHPRDPYTRVDVLDSSRHIRIEIDGETVADSRNAKLLFETGLPTRFYLPKTDVRFDLLTPTDKATSCPYKGTARYWSASVKGITHDNIVWGYDTPLPESRGIEGLVSFYNEKVDIFVDGAPTGRPKTKFS